VKIGDIVSSAMRAAAASSALTANSPLANQAAK